MKRKNILVPTATIAALALSLTTLTANAADHGSELSRSAHRIDDIAHELEDEFRLHYGHLTAYRHIKSDIADVIRKVHHIESLTHNGHSSLRHINADLHSLDRLAHHLHDLVDSAERSRRGGRSHGDTRHVHCLLSSLTHSIHSMKCVTARMAHRGRYDAHRGHGHGSSHSRSSSPSYSYSRSYSGSEAAAHLIRFAIERSRSRH